jgi:ABC-2 type transport system permease protein
MFNVVRKELKSLFVTPMGWVVLAMLISMFGYFFSDSLNKYFEVMSGSLRPEERQGVTAWIGSTVFGAASFFMLFAVPLLTMRTISEERRQQTLTFLNTAPISLTEIVVGKFFGLLAFLSILLGVIFIMMSALAMWADIDYGFILSNLLGLFLLVGSFCALGIYVSSLTQQPVVAAIISFVVLSALLFFDNFFVDSPNGVTAYLSLMRHFQPFSRGLIDTSDIVYFLLFIITFLTLTVRRLDADRLRG